MVQVEHVNSVVRWYESQEDLDLNRPYKSICSMFWLSPKSVFVYGMHGIQSKEMMTEFLKRLTELGVEHIIAERKGRMVTKDIQALLNRSQR